MLYNLIYPEFFPRSQHTMDLLKQESQGLLPPLPPPASKETLAQGVMEKEEKKKIPPAQMVWGMEECKRLLGPSSGAAAFQGWGMLGLFVLLAVSRGQRQAAWARHSLFSSQGSKAMGSASRWGQQAASARGEEGRG